MNWYKKAQGETGNPPEYLDCPECGSKLQLSRGEQGLYYRCENYPDCRVTHGAFEDGRPRGIPGDLETIALRKAAHEKFRKLWINEPNTKDAKQEAFNWLARKMGCHRNQCLMALFNKEQLRRVIGLCEFELNKRRQRKEEQKTQLELAL